MTIPAALQHFTAEVSPARCRKLVAVSGGRDSVALLHALHGAGHRRLVVCHLNHRLRGRAAAADAAFVERLADSLGLPSETGTADVKREAKERGLSLETAGREARHRFFSECARRHRCGLVVMAHHANDQVETALFNLFRGSGGLKGMKASAPLGARIHGRKAISILRPFLKVTREEIDAYIASHRLKFREDATNAEPWASRNRMRLEVLPAIARAMGRDPVPAVLRAMEIMEAEDAYLEGQVGRWLAPPADWTVLPAAGLRDAAPAMQRRVVRDWLVLLHGFPGIGFEEVESVRALLAPDGPRAVNLPGNRFVRRKKGMLRAE